MSSKKKAAKPAHVAKKKAASAKKPSQKSPQKSSPKPPQKPSAKSAAFSLRRQPPPAKAQGGKSATAAKPEPKKIPPPRAYHMQVGSDVLTRLVPHVRPMAGRVPSVFNDLPDSIRPRKVEDGRVYLVEEEGDAAVPTAAKQNSASHFF